MKAAAVQAPGKVPGGNVLCKSFRYPWAELSGYADTQAGVGRWLAKKQAERRAAVADKVALATQEGAKKGRRGRAA